MRTQLSPDQIHFRGGIGVRRRGCASGLNPMKDRARAATGRPIFRPARDASSRQDGDAGAGVAALDENQRGWRASYEN